MTRADDTTEAFGKKTPTLGAYKIYGLLGEGGMGRVYLARHASREGSFALKVLRPQYACRIDSVRRFIGEAELVEKLKHPNIVRVVDIVECERESGESYYVMEFLDGQDLGTLLREAKKLPLSRCSALGCRFAQRSP